MELTPVKRGSPKHMSKRILVVEDQEDDRQIIRDMLARAITTGALKLKDDF